MKLLTRNQFFIVVASFFIFLGVGYYLFFLPIGYNIKEPLRFEIKKGESINSITERLYANGILKNRLLFKIAVFIYGAERNIKAARYKIGKNLSYLDLVELFVFGPADYLKKVRIFDGSTINNIAQSLSQEIKIDSSEFLSLTSDLNFLRSLNLNTNSLEGYLLPDDYELYENSSSKEVILIFVNNLKEFWNDSLDNQAKNLKLTQHEVLTLASIIEGETNYPDEMKLISAVYHNRLKKGMKLQSDPTVQYALNRPWKRLYYTDLKIDSPYNTYKYYGLPPGPINNPGKEAIIAALYPADVDYLFFVADGSGKHKFGKTYKEHLDNVKEYRKWLKTKKSD
ncbi:MAG: endolytic transglycosylase MltG [Ignavibacterium sp.]|nr:endolytic transglycosylase MltG [Ignavibacterium sp.]MDW8375443.1 endolytic transglycosylase MltG [Ignavibacteriales bacterium]